MERLGSRLAPNAGHAVELYSISPHLGAVRSGSGAPVGRVRGENREYYSQSRTSRHLFVLPDLRTVWSV